MYKCVVKVAGRGGVNRGELAEETQHNLNLDTGYVCSQRPWKIGLLSTSLPHRLCCLMTPTKTLCPSHSDILMASQRSPIVSAFVPLYLQFPLTHSPLLSLSPTSIWPLNSGQMTPSSGVHLGAIWIALYHGTVLADSVVSSLPKI